MDDYLSKSAVGKELIGVTGAVSARAAIEQLARGALREAEIARAPVDLERVASFQGVREVMTVDMPSAGRLVPRGDGFVIEVRRDDPPPRRRFTIGHEIGHLLIPSYRQNPDVVVDLNTGAYSSRLDQALETLCDIAAAELTMPMDLFGPAAAECTCTLNTIVQLRTEFNGSWIATLRRLVETNLWPSAMVVWSLDRNVSTGVDSVAGGIPRVQYAVASSSFGYQLPTGLAAPKDGCIAHYFVRRVSNASFERLELPDGAMDFYVQVQPLPRDEWTGLNRNTRVALMLPYLRGKPWPGQPSTWSGHR